MPGLYGIEFSQFLSGGNLQAGDILVGLRSGLNYQFSASSAIFEWVAINVNTNLVPNTGYYTTGGSTLLLTLPVTCPVGATIRIAGFEATGWQIEQNSGQQISIGSGATTSGSAGYLASTLMTDCVEILCVTANVNFLVISSVGNVTVF